MNIQLHKLILTNFKGIRQLTIEFNAITNIHGDNGTGKSTIFDAFTWLLFGKDSHEAKDFNLKTLDETGKAMPMLEHEVEGILSVDGQKTTLRRVYSEKWTRRRGAEQSELTGHETLFYWNGVPLQASEYKTRMETLVNEGLSKLLTSTLYFNSMKWQDRRQVLILIAGKITNTEILGKMNNLQVKEITAILNSGKDLSELRKEIAVRKKKLSDDLKAIPSRIDEVTKGLPEPVDFEAIKADISKKQADLLDVENTITDQVTAYKEKGEAIQAVQNQIFELRETLNSLRFETKTKAQKAQNEQTLKINDLRQKQSLLILQLKDERHALDVSVQSKSALESEISELRAEWNVVSIAELTFSENEFICPTCKRALDQESIAEKSAELIHAFTENNSKRLTDITTRGRRLSVLHCETTADIETTKAEIHKLTASLETLTNQLHEIEATLSPTESKSNPSSGKSASFLAPTESKPGPASVQSHFAASLAESYFDSTPQAVEIRQQIATLELQILEAPKLDLESLKQQKSQLQSEIYNLQVTLGHLDVINRGKTRINELLALEKSLASQISNLEKQEFAMEAYTRSRMDLVEARVNGKFSLVKFRMFNTLINGGIEEACDCMVQGVPYADVNSAGKIQAGIDIINTLSKHYNITAPIWIDNRESTNEIPHTESQLINLIVSKDKSLIIK
jgi:DNA repair exonuclease SbcCD ATPase subunit